MSIFLAITISLGSCANRDQQYKYLSIFFTGIPSYDEYVNNKKKENDSKEEEYEVKTYYAHPLWAENKCSDCHQSEESGDDAANESNLIDIPEKLCIKCHVSKSIRYAIKNKLTIHSPVAQGQCLSCHAAHKSEYAFHLLKPMNSELCKDCHDEDNLSEANHSGGNFNTETVKKYECLACHTSHLSENKNLLSSDFMAATNR